MNVEEEVKKAVIHAEVMIDWLITGIHSFVADVIPGSWNITVPKTQIQLYKL